MDYATAFVSLFIALMIYSPFFEWLYREWKVTR